MEVQDAELAERCWAVMFNDNASNFWTPVYRKGSHLRLSVNTNSGRAAIAGLRAIINTPQEVTAQEESRACLHDLGEGRSGLVVAWALVIEDEQPILKVRDLILVREAVIGGQQVDLAQGRIHYGSCRPQPMIQ